MSPEDSPRPDDGDTQHTEAPRAAQATTTVSVRLAGRRRRNDDYVGAESPTHHFTWSA